MIIPIELSFKADKNTRSDFRTDKTIKSHDVNSVEFHIAIEGLELTNNYTAKILSIFNSSKSQVKTDCEIVDGKIIYKPDTKLISMYETVTNYVYVYHNDQSLDVREFTYTVKLSKIDETALTVKEVYDQSYADLLADFEQALTDYKDGLPQADSVRADIDVILNQFSVDSQAKLSQYDTDAQQVIADNQASFDLAESGRQDTYEQAEDSRNQASEQALVDWNITADAILETVEVNELAREDAETSRKTAENDRAEFYNGFENELNKKANKQQEDWITPTLLNGWYAIRPNEPPQYMKDEFGFVHFRGVISNGESATSNVAFQLPTGYRPSADTTFGIPEINLEPLILSLAIPLTIFTNGDVDFSEAPLDSWYAISSITFKAA